MNWLRYYIKMKIKQTIKKIEEEIDNLEKNFSERDSLGAVWTKKNSKYCGLKEKLSGYKLALKDVLSEIDKINTKDLPIYQEGLVSKYLEQIRKPIQEILKW